MSRTAPVILEGTIDQELTRTAHFRTTLNGNSVHRVWFADGTDALTKPDSQIGTYVENFRPDGVASTPVSVTYEDGYILRVAAR
jgi:hypothetical protein